MWNCNALIGEKYNFYGIYTNVVCVSQPMTKGATVAQRNNDRQVDTAFWVHINQTFINRLWPNSAQPKTTLT